MGIITIRNGTIILESKQTENALSNMEIITKRNVTSIIGTITERILTTTLRTVHNIKKGYRHIWNHNKNKWYHHIGIITKTKCSKQHGKHNKTYSTNIMETITERNFTITMETIRNKKKCYRYIRKRMIP